MSAPAFDTMRAAIVLSARQAPTLRVEDLVDALALGLVAAGVGTVDDAVVLEVAERLDSAVDALMDRGWPTGHALCAARVVNDLRAADLSWSGATLRCRVSRPCGAREAAALLDAVDPALREVAVMATRGAGREFFHSPALAKT